MKTKTPVVKLANATYSPAQISEMARKADDIIAGQVLDPTNVAHVITVMVGQAKNGDAQARRDFMEHVREYRELARPKNESKAPQVSQKVSINVGGKRGRVSIRGAEITAKGRHRVFSVLAELGRLPATELAKKARVRPEVIEALAEENLLVPAGKECVRLAPAAKEELANLGR